MKSTSWMLLTALVALGLLGGCGEDDKDAVDAGVDAAADGDTDSDSDSDTDTSGCVVDAEGVFDDVAFLAAEDLEGRLTGTAQNELALQMAEDRLADIGLEALGDDDTYRQAFDAVLWDSTGTPAVSIADNDLAHPADFEVFSYSGGGDVTAEMVYVGYGMTVPAFDPSDYPDCPLPSTGYDDFAGVDVTGKIALVVRHGPDDDATVPATCPDNDLCGGEECLWNFGYKAANSQAHGAVAMILVQHYAEGPEHMESGTVGEYLEGFPSVFVDRDLVEAAVPGLAGWTSAIDSALAPDPHATGVEASVSVEASTTVIPTANVIGVISGTDPDIGDEVVVVGGHIDHLKYCSASSAVCLGADDDASGAAVTMEVARLIMECANPARTVVFALWNGEELGLLGSAHYVENPFFPLEDHIAAYSVDMVGAGSNSEVVLYGAAATANAWLGQVMAGSAAEMGFGWSVVPAEESAGSDHYYFAVAGIPAVLAMSGELETHPNYHTPNDTIENIDPAALEMSAAMVYAGIKPLVEGTEEDYLTSDKGPDPFVEPVRIDPNSRYFRDR